MARAKVILNPTAGRGEAGRLADEVSATLQALGVAHDVTLTRAVGDGATLAEQAKRDGCATVIAVGGDGTVSEVVNGLMRAAGDGVGGTLGIIPIGTGNDFIKMLDVPLDWRQACAKIAAGQTRRVDVGRVNDRFTTNGVGIGFDTLVGIESRKITWARGTAVYVIGLARTLLLTYRTPRVHIELDGEPIEQDITLISIANGRCYGGGFWVCPNAVVDDGLFDVCLARGLNRLQILSLVPQVMKGTHVDKPPVRMARARKVVVTSDESLPVHLDGEILGTDLHRVEAEMLAGRLEVIG